MKKSLLLFAVALSTYLFGQAPAYSWAIKSGGNGNPDVSANQSAIAVDTINHFVYTTGIFDNGGIDLGGGELEGNSGSYNIYLAKHTLNGALVWAKSFFGNHGCISRGIAVDNTGNIFITGSSGNDTLHMGSQYLVNPTSGSTDMAFVAKLDANGNTVWLKGTSATSDVYARAIAIDAAGNVYVTGDVFDAGGTVFGNAAIEGGFFMKMNGSNGNSVWFKQTTPASPLISQGTSIAIDKAGNCIVAGNYAHDISFGSINVAYSTGSSFWDRFVVKMDATTGAFVWAKGSGIWQGPDCNTAVSLDLQNNIYISGFVSVATQGTLSSSSIQKQFVEKLNSAGISQWLHTYKQGSPSGSSSIATDKRGNTFVTYNVNDTTIYGNDTIKPNPNLPQYASIKMAIVKLNSAGNVLYAKTNGDAEILSYAIASAIAVDTAGAAYVCGMISHKCKFDATTLDAGTASEFLLVKLGGAFVSGINEKENEQIYISVYPNPASETVYINSLEETTINIIDIAGKIIVSKTITKNENNIDVSRLQNGVYILEAESRGKKGYKRLVINK